MSQFIPPKATEAEALSIILADGELLYDETNKVFRMGDGRTPGGNKMEGIGNIATQGASGMMSKEDKAVLDYLGGVSVMPDANSKNLGRCARFIGLTEAPLYYGHVYRCVYDGNAYVWQDTADYVFQVNAIPAAQSALNGLVVVFLGHAAGFVYGHVYQCLYEGGVYKWKDTGDFFNGVTEMPVAEANLEGYLVYYVGTEAGYVRGHHYQCVKDGNSYIWSDIDSAANTLFDWSALASPFLIRDSADTLTMKKGTKIRIDTVDYEATADTTISVVSVLDTGSIAAGKDYYVYLTTDRKFVVSLNSTYPSGTLDDGATPFSAVNTRKVGGFHTLCTSVGTIADHPLSGYVEGDILPASVWCMNHRPYSEPAGMVYCADLDFWVDIYLQSGTGASTASVFGGTTTDTRCQPDHAEDMFRVNKELLSDAEFSAAAEGSNQKTAISGAADPVTTGGHIDSANRRMISNIGCEDMCGALWQWLRDVGPAGGSGWASLPGDKGSTHGAVYALLAGGYWNDSSNCGSRSRTGAHGRAPLYADDGARGRSRSLKV